MAVKRFSLTQARALADVSKTTVLRWVDAGLLNPKKVEGAFLSGGFVYSFSASDVEKMKKMKRGRGRPALIAAVTAQE